MLELHLHGGDTEAARLGSPNVTWPYPGGEWHEELWALWDNQTNFPALWVLEERWCW